MKEMPEAQKRGSLSAPGICLANSGGKVPCTVEVWQPTFSNTRPDISDMTPPPPSLPSGSVRVQGVRVKRPAGSPGIEGRALGFVLDRLERRKHVVAQGLEPDPRALFSGLERCRIGREGLWSLSALLASWSGATSSSTAYRLALRGHWRWPVEVKPGLDRDQGLMAAEMYAGPALKVFVHCANLPR